MLMQEPILWRKLQDFELDDPNASLCFSERLARENGWTHSFTLRAIEEYKRFLYLLCVCNEPLTPSDQVDQVWHLHLIYTRSYWKDLCANVLQREIHHGPTQGGQKELMKFTDWYTQCKLRYREHFLQEPPIDLWPEASDRFNSFRFQRVDLTRYWLIKRPILQLR